MKRLQYTARSYLLVLCTFLSTTEMRAAVTPTGNVQPVLPWNTNTGAFIGRMSDGSLLVNGGSVLTSLDGNLGFEAGVTGEVKIADPGSQWNMRSILTIGRNGIGILNLDGGGQLTASPDRDVYIGRNSGSLGTATVTGAGSKLTGGYMRVGEDGTGSLNVKAGGLVTSTSAMIGYEDTATGTVVVSGAGSEWDVEGGMRVGWVGSGSLRIESGGKVNSGNNFNSWLAYQPGSTGAVTVTGPGSQWNSGFQLFVGHRGQANVDVTDGGVINTLSTRLGYEPSASGTVTVTGTGSKWNNTTLFEVGTSGTAKLTVADGSQLTTGTLYASLADLFGNGTISATRGAIVDATLNFDAAHGTQALTTFGSAGTLTVKAAGGDLGVGYKDSGNLTVTDGVQVASDVGYLAYNPGSTGTATVSGMGSQWTTGNNLNIGHRGTGSLTVEDSAKVMSELVSVGNFGSGALNVLTGGQVMSATGKVGAFSTSTGLANIAGAGSQWNVGGDLLVGDQGSGTLNISAGGLVTSAMGFVRGWSEGRTGNVSVTGTDSEWNIDQRLTIGERGTLTVADGGNVEAATLYASLDSLQGDGTIVATSGARLDADFVFDAATPGQQVLAFGTGGTLTVNTGGELGVGYKTKGTLLIHQGVTVHSTEGYIHGQFDSQSEAKISGPGSRWALTGSLRVGGLLTIEHGGKVFSATSVIENGNNSDPYNVHPSAVVTVKDAGSEWVNSGELNVGYNGTGILIVKDGGVVHNTDAYLGRDQYEGGNGKVLVTGNGSQWNNRGSLSIGVLGYGELTVADGGWVTSDAGYLRPSYGDISIGASRVLVSGVGSKWTIRRELDIREEYVSSVVVTIAGGGEITNASANVGGTIAVIGHGSRWINRGDVSMGGTLHIRDGGVVKAPLLYLWNDITIDVGSGSLISIGEGNGMLYSEGTIRFLAGHNALSGSQHSPVTAGTWFTGKGSYEAVGGTWDAVNHVFTVSDTVMGTPSAPLTVDLTQDQKLLIEDTTHGRDLSISLLAKSGLATVTGTVLDDAILNELAKPNLHLLSGWNLDISGSAVGDPLYLSFAIPSALDPSVISVWKREGNFWQALSLPDLTVSGGFASFTASSGGAYALTAVVPEPSTQLLAILLATTWTLQRRRPFIP